MANDKPGAMIGNRRFTDMQPGDVLAYEGQPRAKILRTNEDFTDRFGQKLKAHWCRALDGSDREGFVAFGPEGVGPVELR